MLASKIIIFFYNFIKLSSSLFILCMVPLIRKVNGDNEIEGLNIGINGEYQIMVTLLVKLKLNFEDKKYGAKSPNLVVVR